VPIQDVLRSCAPTGGWTRATSTGCCPRSPRRHGTELTKNEARATVRAAGLPPGAPGCGWPELPRDTLERLLEAVPDTARLARS